MPKEASMTKPKRATVRETARAYADATGTTVLDALATGDGWTLDLGTELELAERVRQGISTKAVDDAVASGLIDLWVVHEFVLPRRTFAHRKDRKQALKPEESDRFARLLRIHARAADALGDKERASRWLRHDNRALGGRRPIDLLSSDAGSRAVEKVLGRIEHGIVS